MIKKLIVLFLILITCVGFSSYAASWLTVDVSIDYNTDIVTVTGEVTGNAGWITCHTEGPTTRLVYIGSAAVEGGSYEVKFKILDPILKGEYRLTIKAEGMAQPRVVTFIYDPDTDVPEPEVPEPEVPGPDDHPNTSEEAALINLDPSIINILSGVIDYREDVDWFKVGSSTSDKYSFLMNTANEDIKLAIYDSNLSLLTTDKSYLLDFTASAEYYIEVTYTGTDRFRKVSYSIQIGKLTTNPGETIIIDSKPGKAYNVSLNAIDSTDIGAKTFTITYDASLLKLITAAKQAPTPQTAAGNIPSTDISILSHSNGVLTIQVKRPAINAYTGMVTILSFEGIADGTAEVVMG
jgi:hypothetical protein